MRKRLRSRVGRNRHRCVCKPNKTGQSVRWNPREFQRIKEFEKEAKYVVMATN